MFKEFLFVVFLLLCTCFDALAAPVRSVISGLPKKKPADAVMVVRRVSLADASVISSKTIKRGSAFSANAPVSPELAVVDWFSISQKLFLTGRTKLLAKGVPLKPSLKVKLAKPRAAKISSRFAASAVTNAFTIGIPASAFTAAGPGTHEHTGRGLAAMLTTELAQAQCYNADGGFQIIEVDPKVLSAIKAEEKFCKSRYANKATCSKFNYVPPSSIVMGGVFSTGQTFRIDLNVIGPDGGIKSSVTVEGSDYFKLIEQAGALLGQQLCQKGTLEVGQATCAATSAPGCEGGVYWVAEVKGAATGTVGSIIRSNYAQSGATLSCPGWTEYACDNSLRCCKRESETQPERTSFTVQFINPPEISFIPGMPPYRPPWCPGSDPIPVNFVVQFFNLAIDLERSVVCGG